MPDGQFRPPLDIGPILEDFQQRWDNSASTAGGKIDHSKSWWEQEPGALDREAEQRAREAERQRRLNEPYVVGSGPTECSTSTVLERLPVFSWDVNGYYRSLGVHWKATRKELREAYQRLDGQSSVYLTYVLKQLVNSTIRFAYDMSPPGEPFLDDIYVQDALKRKASEEAARRTKAGVFTTAREVVEEDFKFIPDTPTEGVDGPDEVDKSASNPELSDPGATLAWSYSYYLWKSREMEASERMARWQELLVREIANAGEVIRLAVGSVGRMAHPYVIGQVGNQFVVFLNEKNKPSAELAASAVVALLRTRNETPNQSSPVPNREISR